MFALAESVLCGDILVWTGSLQAQEHEVTYTGPKKLPVLASRVPRCFCLVDLVSQNILLPTVLSSPVEILCLLESTQLEVPGYSLAILPSPLQ